MKVLYIDTESFPTHANFNRIHIRALQKVGCEVYCVLKVGYKQILQIPDLKVVYEIPVTYYETGRDTPIRGRFLMLKRLFCIKKNVDFRQYDKILLSYYDETVLPFAFYPKGLYLINHVNIGGLKYWLKRKMFLYLSLSNIQIVLTKAAFNYIGKLGVTKKELVYHGLPNPYNSLLSTAKNKHKYTIFSPSAQSSDFDSISQLLNSDKFIEFLKERDIEFIIRSKVSLPKKSNVQVLTSYMCNEDYQQCFLKSDIILISYKKTFMYRVSAVLLECIANKKNVIIKKHLGLKEYESILGKDVFYESVDEAISAIDAILCKHQKICYDRFNFEPNYHFLMQTKHY